MKSRYHAAILIVLILPFLFLCGSCSATGERERQVISSPADNKGNGADNLPPETGEKDRKGEMEMVNLNLISSAFKNGENIPKKYSGEGADISPPLSWDKPPRGTASLVLICDDPDAPVGTWDHWIIFNIKPDMKALAEDTPLPEGAKMGRNSWGKMEYGGPAPPPGKVHRYFFKIYAVDKNLDMSPGSDKKTIEKMIEGHILGTGKLIGTYKR